MTGQGADQLTRLALRPERGVDLPDGAGCGVGRADPGQLGRHPGRHGDRLLAGDQRLAGVVEHRFGDEEHVDVADVVEFLGPALAEADARPAGSSEPFGPTLARAMASAASSVASARSDNSSATRRHHLDRLGSHRSRAAIRNRCTPVGDPQAVAGRARWPPAAQRRGRRRPTGAARRGGSAVERSGSSVEQVEVIGMGDQVLAERLAVAQDHDQMPGQHRASRPAGPSDRAPPPRAGPARSGPDRGRRHRATRSSRVSRSSVPAADRIRTAAAASLKPRLASTPWVVSIRLTGPRCYLCVTVRRIIASWRAVRSRLIVSRQDGSRDA